MSKPSHVSHRMRTPFTAGLVVGLISLLVSVLLPVTAAWAAAPAAPALQDGVTPTPDPADCAACHPNIDNAWQGSMHANAYTDTIFQARWKSLGEPGDCLICHTTGYDATTGQYTAASVTCEACHGKVQEGHPPATMPIRSDTEYCGTCHTITLSEWRLSGHASAGVGCTDCHNPHSQKARFENTNEMCINCHKDNLGEHKNDTHIQKGIECVECHAMILPPETEPVDGLAPTGHAFSITSATCVACHTDILHVGKPVPGYEAGARAVGATLPVSPTLPALIETYAGEVAEDGTTPEQKIQVLEAALASTRLSTLFQGGMIGLVLGGTTFYLLARNQQQASRSKPEKSEEKHETASESAAEESAHE